MTHLGQPPRNFWTLPAHSPDWMRPPDWMALGNPGKIVGMMYDERRKRWVPVEAAAGLGNPGKIVGFDPVTGRWLEASAGLGELSPGWTLVTSLALVGGLFYLFTR